MASNVIVSYAEKCNEHFYMHQTQQYPGFRSQQDVEVASTKLASWGDAWLVMLSSFPTKLTTAEYGHVFPQYQCSYNVKASKCRLGSMKCSRMTRALHRQHLSPDLCCHGSTATWLTVKVWAKYCSHRDVIRLITHRIIVTSLRRHWSRLLYGMKPYT